MSEPRFWVFSPPSGKGVNTRTDNLRVHTAGSDTRTTYIRENLGKFPIMATKQSVWDDWSGVATGVRRSWVPLVTNCEPN
jgi:hypothetical protein